MYRKFICPVTFILVLGITDNALADLIDHWKFDEGSGNTAINNVASGIDGTINGATWVSDPPRGVALSFDGIDDVVNMVGYKAITGGASRSMCLWFKTDGGGTGPNGRGLLGWGTPQGAGVRWELAINMQGDPRIPGALRINASSGTRTCQTVVTDSEWHHVAVTLHDDGSPTSEEMYVYLDGVEESYSQTNAGVAINTGSDADVRVGNGVREDQNGFFTGLIDDVRIYDHALTEAEILAAMAGAAGGYPFALSPNPANGALLEATWANLTWSAGDFAVSHDVYIGDNFDDVNEGAEGTFVGNQATTTLVIGFPGFAIPDGLVPGTTYYWRIDEVNDADPNSPWKGDIWSFSIPPKTAYYPGPADGAESVTLDAELSWTAGFGGKLHTVYFGDNFDDIDAATGGTAQTSTTFTPPGPLELAKTYYWRVDEFDPPTTYKGDVWSFTTEGTAANPNPAKGAVDVSPTPVLKWTPASLAASHEVYLGVDADAVANATKASPEYKGSQALGEESYDAGRLDLLTTYYWRVDEVNGTNPGSPWAGNVWDFTTGDFLVVDDFEAYNDIDPPDPASNRIFDKWIDGFGTTDNGALVGNDLPPYAEQTIVHGGAQSMIYRYDNANKTSEATMTLVYPRDWTEEGVTKLSLWFRGASGNSAERMFIALNGTAVVYHDDPAATQITGWNEWIIDLTAFGVDLTNVNTITIGFGTKGSPAADGGTGTMYFDDIRLIR
ncbi:MAG: LamG domain-containing protein [Planctomycetota bacterium]|jgi:hypothetical protein